MVRTILRLFNKETSSLHQAAYLLGLFAILSQVLAFLRDRLLASIFGAGHELDIYYAAFRIPDFIFVSVASIVSLSVLVPFIIEKEEGGREKVREFISDIFSFFFYLIVIVCAISYFLMPWVSAILFKGLPFQDIDTIVYLSRVLLLSPVFLGFSNLFGSLTQAYNRFFVYALAPLLYNSGIIFGIVIFAPRLGIFGVVCGVVMGAMLHMLIQIPFITALGFLPRLKAAFDFQAIKRVVGLSLPRTLTLSTSQFATLFLVSMASLMTVGSISVFSFSLNIQSISLSIIGVSYSLAAFPTLTRYFANKDIGAFIKQMSTTARHIIFWSVPLTALFVILRAQIVRVLLGSGNFDWNDTRLTAAAFALFSISAVFQSLILLFIRGFYSAGYTKKPFYINILSAIIIISSTYLSVKLFYWSSEFRYFIEALFRVGDLPGTEVLMLPLGFSFGTIISGIIHWVTFERNFKGFSHEVRRVFFESIAASVLMAAIAYLALAFFVNVFVVKTLLAIFLQGFFAGVCGIVTGIIILLALKNKEILEVWKAIHAKFWRTKVIATDPEIV